MERLKSADPRKRHLQLGAQKAPGPPAVSPRHPSQRLGGSRGRGRDPIARLGRFAVCRPSFQAFQAVRDDMEKEQTEANRQASESSFRVLKEMGELRQRQEDLGFDLSAIRAHLRI